MENKKKLTKNMFTNILAFLITTIINFLITPYLVKVLGNEAYGFIGLANNFVSYATILTVALNSMASRFITIEIHKKNNEKANIYFNSLLFSNIIISILLVVVSAVTVINLDSLINISPELITDIKMTFALSFLNFIIGLIMSVYGIATFVKNRLDIVAIRNVVINIVRVIIVLLLLFLLKPKVTYILIAATICTILTVFSDKIFTKKLLPQLKVNFKLIKLDAIKMLTMSGMWNSLNSLTAILLTGLDLIIANLFLGGGEMGILSIAKMVPTQIMALLVTVAGIFLPQFTMLYAKNDISGLTKEVKFSTKILTLILSVPIAGFLIFGTEFYSLWLPYKSAAEIMQIQILSILTLLPNIISSYIHTYYSINTVTNKLKVPVLLTLVLSIISTAIVFVLIKTTNLGIYAIAGVSSIILTLRVIIFVPVYAAKNLKLKWNTFYPELFKSLGCFAILCGIFYVMNIVTNVDSWLKFVIIAAVSGIVGYGVNLFTVFNKQERKSVLNVIKNKFIKTKIEQ